RLRIDVDGGQDVRIEQFLNLDLVLGLDSGLERRGLLFGQRCAEEFQGLQEPRDVTGQRLTFDGDGIELLGTCIRHEGGRHEGREQEKESEAKAAHGETPWCGEGLFVSCYDNASGEMAKGKSRSACECAEKRRCPDRRLRLSRAVSTRGRWDSVLLS